jgi:hypothetical protein
MARAKRLARLAAAWGLWLPTGGDPTGIAKMTQADMDLGRSLMIVRRSLGLALAVVCIFASAQGAWAASATEQLKSAIDRVLATVDNPALKGDENVVDRRAAVHKIANEIFDFREVARRSLGRYWQPLSEAQRTEFVGLFGDLLERSYVFQNRALQRRTDHVQRRARGRRPRHRQHQDHYQERHRGASGLPPLQARRQMDDL